MFITPMEGLEGIRKISGYQEEAVSQSGQAGAGMFQDVFTGLVGNAAEADRNLAEKQYLLSVGQIDDVHTVPIAAAQAELSVNLLIQVRNKALEAYNELMRLSV